MSVGNSVFLPVRVLPAVKQKLDALAKTVKKSRSATLTVLIMKATPEDLPACWRESAEAERQLMAEAERWQAE